MIDTTSTTGMKVRRSDGRRIEARETGLLELIDPSPKDSLLPVSGPDRLRRTDTSARRTSGVSASVTGWLCSCLVVAHETPERDLAEFFKPLLQSPPDSPIDLTSSPATETILLDGQSRSSWWIILLNADVAAGTPWRVRRLVATASGLTPLVTAAAAFMGSSGQHPQRYLGSDPRWKTRAAPRSREICTYSRSIR